MNRATLCSDYDSQVHEIARALAIDAHGSGTIGIHVIRARAGRPVDRRRLPADDTVVDLSNTTFAIEVRHG